MKSYIGTCNCLGDKMQPRAVFLQEKSRLRLRSNMFFCVVGKEIIAPIHLADKGKR